MVHAGCMGGLEVLQRCRVGVRCTCMESDRVHVYMHGVTILQGGVHAWEIIKIKIFIIC